MSRVRCLVLVAGSIAGSVAHAEPRPGPSPPCSRGADAVVSTEATIERAVCADPVLSASDRSLGRAFRVALAKPGGDGADLHETQRTWLKARAAACGTNVASPSDLASCLRALHRDRVAGLDAAAARDNHMCRAVAGRIREKDGFLASHSLGDGLRDDPASPIAIGKPEAATKALLAALPDTTMVQEPDGLSDLYHFGAIRSLFAVVAVQGTANCEYISLYKIVKGGAFAPLDPPASLRENEGNCGNATLFGSFAEPNSPGSFTPLYVDSVDAIGGSSLAFTVRRDDTWQPACTITTAFETELSMGRRFCAKGVDCDALASRALDLARRRDAFGADAPARLDADSRLPAEETKEQVGLPTFGVPDVDAWASFEGEAPVYAVAGPHGRLLMRISHGTVGWRTNEDWLVGVYERRGGDLRPLAGFMIAKSRTKLAGVSIR